MLFQCGFKSCKKCMAILNIRDCNGVRRQKAIRLKLKKRNCLTAKQLQISRWLDC